MSAERLRNAAREIRRAAEAVESSDLYVPGNYERAVTDLDSLGFFRTPVARLVADWLEACAADLDSFAGHVASCDEPDSIERASAMADLILGDAR